MDALPAVTAADELEGRVGSIVTLRGVVARTKLPTILGVEVDAAPGLVGVLAEATGRLEAYTIDDDADPFAAHPSPGRRLMLVADGSLAPARPVGAAT